MNIDGLGPSIVENLINNKLITNVVDLYHLTVEQLVTMDRMGKKVCWEFGKSYRRF